MMPSYRIIVNSKSIGIPIQRKLKKFVVSFLKKYADVRCKYLKVGMAPLSCEEGFVYPGDIISCLKKDRELLDIFECENCKFYEAGDS